MLNEFKNINYFNICSNEMLGNLITDNIKPNFIMFDGPENPNIAYDDIKTLENFIDDIQDGLDKFFDEAS